MQCGFHAYMESWAMAVNNPYYALTDDERRIFTIETVPAWNLSIGRLASADRPWPDQDGHREGRREIERAVVLTRPEG